MLLGLVAMISPAAGEPHSGHSHGPAAPGHDFSNLDRWIQRFEDPAREGWQQPDRVVELLELEPGMRVADIGAGTGYFTRRFARAVGPGGDAFAVDLEPALLAYVRERARAEGLSNLFAHQGAPDDPRLPPRSMDRVFMCNTLHHVDGRPAFLRALRELLREDGRLMVVEYYRDREIPVGPPAEMRLDPVALTREMEQAGFAIQRLDVLPYQYILIGR